ncbi:hypothetical protein J3F84DRAFT_398617 [Trichoderma pleuroticola]
MAAISTTTRKALPPTSRDDFEIAIVCAKALEYDAVCLLVDGFWDEDGDSFGRAEGDPNTYTTVAAASTAASLRSSYPCIKLLLLTGTCDGVPNAMGKELLLGDVVISDTVVQYDLGRRYPNGFRESNTLEDRLGRPNKNVRNLVAIFKTEMGLQRLEKKASSYLRKIQDMEFKEQRQKRRRATYQYPGSTNDILFRSNYCHKHYRSPQCICDDHKEAGDPKKLEDDGDEEAAQQPSIFVGRFGSGDTDFNSAIDRDHIAQKHNIIAFETEGAGVWDELSCIIIKGVSTYGDGHIMSDLDAWENFAAATAASAARGLIDYYPQTDRLPSVESKNQTEIAFKNQADITCLRDLYITSPLNDKIRIEQTKGGLLMDAYATDSHLNNALLALRGLLYMLISKQPHLIPYVRHEYEKSGKSIFEDSNSWIILSRIFFEILKDPSIKDMIFIVDALDECLTDLTQFLDRNETNVQDVLLNTANKSVISLELNSESVSAAIRTYIHYQVELLSKEKRYQQDTRDSIQEYLINNADGTFLWVAVVCEMLKKAPSFDPRPKSVAEFHWGSRILAISTLARRPLSIQELETLTFSPSNRDDTIKSLEKCWEEALGYCGNFLTKRKGVVYFIHQSAKDFIINKASDKLFSDGTKYVNRCIFEVSISTMMNTLRRDIYRLIKPGFLIDDLTSQDVPSPDPLAPVRYCCVCWIDHFVESISHSDNNNGQELIYNFLKEKYIYWLEALSLLRSMYHGLMGMQKLDKLLNQIWDARRFIQMFGKAIGDAPLQVSISALLFSPTESITRKQFEAEAPHWARIWPSDVTNWTSCVRRLDGDPKACIEFPTKMGSLGWFNFSLRNNNELIVYNSCRESLAIWDVTSGRVVRRARGLRWITYGIALLPSAPDFLGMIFPGDNKNDNNIFALWNTQKDEVIQTRSLSFKGYVEDIAFSPVSNDILAMNAGSLNGRQIIIYNIDTNDIIRTFDLGWIRYIAFSPNGKYLASFTKPISDERMPTCTLLDTMTGETILKIEIQSYPNGNPAFSNDGQLLAVGSENLIQIWDLASRQCLQRSKAASYCPVFSPNRTGQLFCGAVGSVAIIEVGQHEMAPLDLRPYQQREKQISISPDGRLVATWDTEVLKIWNTDSGSHRDDNWRTHDGSGYGIDSCGSWITLDAQRLIWLPPEYRLLRSGSYWDVRRNCVAISNRSTPLFILKLCCSMCPRRMTPKSGVIAECTSTAPERHKYTCTRNLDDDVGILSLDYSKTGARIASNAFVRMLASFKLEF